MIKTKEQYEEAQFVGDREFSHKVMDPQGLTWVVDAIFDLRETVEALRRVARAGRKMLNDHTDFDPMERQYNVHVDASAIEDLERSLDALHYWLIEE